MSDDYGASHWSSDKVWNRKVNRDERSKNLSKIIHFRINDEDNTRIEAIREFLNKESDLFGIDCNNDSELMRRIVKYAYVHMLELKEENEEKEKTLSK